MDTIIHITSREKWLQGQEGGIYRCESLDTERFIHCSKIEQVVTTANRVFRGQGGLVLLAIAPSLVNAEIKEEEVPLHGCFPHIYGELNLDAVVRVVTFEPNKEGEFEFPLELG